jgi:gliding motility associated protien GldN
MSILNKYQIALATLVLSGSAFAQGPMTADKAVSSEPSTNIVSSKWAPSLVRDGVIDRVEHVNKASEWSPIREIDVAWYQRVWRKIDVRQKQNEAFIYQGDEYTGGGAFIEILIDAVKKGKVAAYNAIDDRFTTPLNLESFESAIGGGVDTLDIEDVETGEITKKITRREFDINTVTQYLIKEDWVFDRNLGRRVVRIVGIAPLKDVYNTTTQQFLYSTPMFWLYYPDARNVLATYEVYNPQNMIRRMSWSDYLDGGYFASTIIKYSKNNVDGRDYNNKGLEGLMQGERVMQDLINMESDMWEQ